MRGKPASDTCNGGCAWWEKARPRFLVFSCRLFYRTNLVHSLRAGCFKSAVLMGIYNEILFWQSYREIFPEKMNIEERFSTLREELILRRMVAKYPSLSGEEIMNQFGKESMQWYIMALENKDWGKEWYLWEDCWWKTIKRVERIQKGAWAYDKKLKYVRRYIITALNHEERDWSINGSVIGKCRPVFYCVLIWVWIFGNAMVLFLLYLASIEVLFILCFPEKSWLGYY